VIGQGEALTGVFPPWQVSVAGEPSYEQLVADNAALRAENAELKALVAELSEQVAELTRRLAADSSNSSRPPSSDAPWDKPAKKRSSRTRSGRRPGKQSGASSSSRRLVDDPDEVVVIEADRCHGCAAPLADAPVVDRQRRQVVDAGPVPAPEVIEYRRVSKACGCCGAVTTPGWEAGEGWPGHAETVAAPGSPVRIGPETLARCALLTCGHHLPVGRARQLLAALSGMDVATGSVAAVRGRAARKLEREFLGHMKTLLTTSPVLHADETCGRAAGAVTYVHVACTEYLTLMHVGGRSKEAIDAGGVLPAFTGVLVRDGYAGYDHLPALHAWCGAHLLRDLRSISDADPDGQLWATAMATALTEAHTAAANARERGADALDAATLTRIRRLYLGALARGEADNQGEHTLLADRARTLIERFRRYEDMILRFAADPAVPFTNNEAERAVRPVKVQQRTSGGCWRTIEGLTDFAIVHSYLDTAAKWGLDKLEALRRLFTTGAWLPPAISPS
jgi:transposase